MTVIVILTVIVAGLLVILMLMQRRVASLSSADARLEAKDALIQGRDEIIRQKDVIISTLEERAAAADGRLKACEESLRQAGATLERERSAHAAVRADAAKAEAALAAMRERIEATESERERTEKAATEHFRNLANEIFEAQTQRFKENSEKRLEELLSPLKTDLDGFRKAVSEAYSSEAKERFSLQNEIRHLMELNRSIGKEAQELSRALKGDSKVQGDWGEMILERLLEMSGLQKGCHFITQATVNPDGSKITGDDGRQLRPDVVVNYPDGRCVVVDSKVSLSAYMDYVNAEGDADRAADAARRHILSVRRHIAELADKRYQDLVGEKRLDFVMMFIPNEGAYFALMRLEPGIWEEAYGKRVLLTSPTHLISVLRMLEQLWKQDAINRNVQEIARLSGTMLDKFANFISDMDNIQKHLTAAQSAYSQARNRLDEGKGNVLVTARKIVNLGAKTTKSAEIKRLAPDDEPELADGKDE